MSFPTSDIFQHIRRIHIKTKKAVEDLFAGVYHSVFKGKGLEFEDVREYQPGDEIRRIDWNVTARLQHPYVKNFREERQLTVMIIVDISASSRFASTDHFKSEMMAEIGALLAFSAIENQDKVGLILFSNELELYLSPKRGIRHGLRVIRELLFFQPRHSGTNLEKALAFLGKIQRKRCICFFLSDFLTEEDFSQELALVAKRHELIVIQLTDRYEHVFPRLGLVTLKDLESQEIHLIDTSNAELHSDFREQAGQRQAFIKQAVERSGADFLSIYTHESYLEALHKFFRLRGQRR